MSVVTPPHRGQEGGSREATARGRPSARTLQGARCRAPAAAYLEVRAADRVSPGTDSGGSPHGRHKGYPSRPSRPVRVSLARRGARVDHAAGRAPLSHPKPSHALTSHHGSSAIRVGCRIPSGKLSPAPARRCSRHRSGRTCFCRSFAAASAAPPGPPCMLFTDGFAAAAAAAAAAGACAGADPPSHGGPPSPPPATAPARAASRASRRPFARAPQPTDAKRMLFSLTARPWPHCSLMPPRPPSANTGRMLSHA